MPGFNKKGPMGKGPMTGRALGRCGDSKGQLGDRPEKNLSDEFMQSLRLRRRDRTFRQGSGRGRFGG